MAQQQNYGRSPQGQSHQRYDSPRPEIEIPNWEDIWVKNGINKGGIIYAEKLGKVLADQRFTTSQFRNFYGELKRIQLRGIGDLKSPFHLLKPKLAYAAKRANSIGAETFKKEVFKAHDAVAIDAEGFEKRFSNFCDLVEAILAFHKAYGGKD